MAWSRSPSRVGIVVVVAAAFAVGGSAVGYAAGKSKPLSSVCVAKKGSHTLSAPGKHGCPKGTTRTKLSSAVKGDRGAPGATSVVRPTVTKSVPAFSFSSNIAYCPRGSTAIGGGYDLASSSASVRVVRNTFQIDNGVATGWQVAVVDNDPQGSMATTIKVTATCAKP